MSGRPIVSFGFALVLLAGFGAGCSGKAPESPAASAQTPETTSPAQAANDPAAEPTPYDPANAAGAVNAAEIAAAVQRLDPPGQQVDAAHAVVCRVGYE